MARLLLAVSILLACAGCFMPPALEVPAALLSLGSLGNTAINVYYAQGRPPRTAVARLPEQYRNNPERMLIETWESGYQLAKSVSWQEREIPWQDMVQRLDREATPLEATLVLVERQYSHRQETEEEVAVYISRDGVVTDIPDHARPFYVEMRTKTVSHAVLKYRAWFFVKNTQPDGLLATQGPWNGPCRTAYSYGAAIMAVDRDSPAQQADIRVNDVITAVNGQEADYQSLHLLLQKGGNRLDICRNGERLDKVLVLP